MKKHSVSSLLLILNILTMHSCTSIDKKFTITQLTQSQYGHTLHHNGVFSKDGQWVVFDGRNDDTKIGETAEIGVVNLFTGEEKIIYRTKSQTLYGPGVGAASFSHAADRVIFIHGLPGANEEKPYGFTRRTGVAIDLERPFVPVGMDARDITAPYTPGSLRGGTHSHCWSPDGRLISFTYNDELTEPDLRTVGVMFDAGTPVLTDQHPGNNNGVMYAALIAAVVPHPKPGSDEISKAFDECWVGNNGYINATGQTVPYAIAFQGHTKNEKGETIAEIYIADIDTSLVVNDLAAVGKPGERPRVPKGLQQRRLSHTEKGLSAVRHWLRSSNDGRYIYALAEDNRHITQIIRCDTYTGQVDYMTKNDFSIQNPFNLSPDGHTIAFVGNNNVYLLPVDTKIPEQLTHNGPGEGRIVGAPCFSPDGKTLVFNQYKKTGDKEWLQVFYAK